MAGRRADPEVQRIFEKYVSTRGNVVVRRLAHEDALNLLKTEYQLGERHARELLLYFDADMNGSLSLWEFQHFHTLAGNRAPELVQHYDDLDQSKQGYLSMEQMDTALRNMQTADGTPLDDRDVEFLLRTSKQDDKVKLGDFIAILYRLKLYKKNNKSH